MTTRRQIGGKSHQLHRDDPKSRERAQHQPRPQSHESVGRIQQEPSGESMHRPNIERELEHEPAGAPSGGARNEERDCDRE